MTYTEHPDYAPRNRLHRSRDGMFLGVCAGIAEYFGMKTGMVRILTLIGALVFFPTVPIAYLILAILLTRAPAPRRLGTHEQEELRRNVRADPHSILDNQRYRFRELDRRLQRLEKYVTSSRFRLEKEFAKLED